MAGPLLGVIAAVLTVLVLLVAPAFGQNRGDDVQYNAICQNILGSGDSAQIQNGTATAVAGNGESTSSQEASAVAEVAQEQGVSIAQVNDCLNGATAGDRTTDETTGGTTNQNTADTTGDTTTSASTTADGESDVIASTIPDQKVLANTGGPALVLMPALGLLLISSVAIRNILRR